jgi:hypothetical protein
MITWCRVPGESSLACLGVIFHLPKKNVLITIIFIHQIQERPLKTKKIHNVVSVRSIWHTSLDFEKVVERVSILLQVEKDYITGRGRQKDRVRAKDLLWYWTVFELGMPMVDLARKFDITRAAVSYAVQWGEKMANEGGYQMETWVIRIFKVPYVFFIWELNQLWNALQYFASSKSRASLMHRQATIPMRGGEPS